MDETVYQQTLTSSLNRYCPFEKTLLTHCAACSKADKRNIAEREVLTCNSAEAHERCIALRDLLRQKFTFALGKLQIDGPLPHAQEMRMQCGGLKGVQFVLDGSNEVFDVSGLLDLAQQHYGVLKDFPYDIVVQRAMTDFRFR